MFQKATKEKSKLRLAIAAPSGAGKTKTSLRIASGMSDSIALIDTERGSASKYAGDHKFDVCDLDDHSVQSYVSAINFASEQGYEVLIIDSLSHAWHQLLQEVEKIAKAKYRGNTWSAWSEGTPIQKTLVNAILNYPGHVIATLRTKTEWITETTNNGKSRPVKVGLAPEQGKGIEYEFDMLIEMNHDHFATFAKDRTGKYQDVTIEKPGEDFGKELIEWLSDGATRQEVLESQLIDYEAMLEASNDIKELHVNWNKAGKWAQSQGFGFEQLESVKDQMKEKLTQENVA